jgi:hypothetical protein
MENCLHLSMISVVKFTTCLSDEELLEVKI